MANFYVVYYNSVPGYIEYVGNVIYENDDVKVVEMVVQPEESAFPDTAAVPLIDGRFGDIRSRKHE